MLFSIIIPTFNESLNISRTINHLKKIGFGIEFEIIISDAGSQDNTLEIAKKLGARVYISDKKGRSGQMNFGVTKANGEVYYFVHADCLPNKDCFLEIEKALKKGFDCGTFLTKFDSRKFIFKINEWCTKINYLYFRGGDQTIFITKSLWKKVGTYNSEMFIMEDYDFLKRLYQFGKFKLIQKPTLVSARKFEKNSYFKVQKAFYKIIRMYKNGYNQEAMISTYNKMLDYRVNSF